MASAYGTEAMVGYTTEFEGQLQIEPMLRPEHLVYLERFAETRRMKRDPIRAGLLPDPVRIAAGLPIGPDGAYYVGSDDHGFTDDPSVIDFSRSHAPFDDPIRFSLYCSWAPSADGSALIWNGAENFYEHDRWLEFLIEHFLNRWGYRLNGRLDWQGDDPDDRGSIFVRDNVVRAVGATVQVTDPFAQH